MRNHVATLMSDFYKQTHAEQYSDKITKLVDYFTPRISRLKDQDKLICFGVQGFIKDFLIDYFNETFFNVPKEQVMKEHKRVIDATLGPDTTKYEKIEKLYDLGYLPIEIKAIPEGSRVPMHVPMIEISNTHPDFAWVVGFIESVMSCELWYPMTIANQAYKYRQIVNKYYDETVEKNSPLAKHAISEFGFRGADGREAAVLASAAFLTSFDKTATIPAIMYLEDYYNCNMEDGNVAGGMISTEHSVMCSNAALDGDEETFLNKLFTEIYPKNNISVVCDSYDYWNVVENIICKKLKNLVMNRQGTLYVRGDSGNPVDIVCGTRVAGYHYQDFGDKCINEIINELRTKYNDDVAPENGNMRVIARTGYNLYELDITWYWDEKEGCYTHIDSIDILNNRDMTVEELGTVELLWKYFGGTVNKLGYKVLDNHIRAIYGDSITPLRAKEIYERLKRKGFAANNVALGAGSFSMHCDQEEDFNRTLNPFTRDTYGIAIKATYAETSDGKQIPIFKNPKTDSGHFKKSQKGMCCVHYDKDGNITFMDGYTSENCPIEDRGNLLETVFKDGHMVKEYSIHDIRNRLHEKF